MNILLVKITLMPVVIALVTLGSRRWGHKVGGLIASMPWMAGAILLFLIVEQGKLFGIRAVPGILTGVLSLIAFCYCYARLSFQFNAFWTLMAAYIAFVAVAFLFTAINLDLVPSYILIMVSVLICLRFFPAPSGATPPTKRLLYDLPIRMVVATLFLLAITGLASFLGPTWSGILTPFPIITTILAVFTHYLSGSNAVVGALRGIVLGLLGFTTFLFLQAFLLQKFSVGESFFFALIINGIINFIVGKLD